jgi:hypothetical protein
MIYVPTILAPIFPSHVFMFISRIPMKFKLFAARTGFHYLEGVQSLLMTSSPLSLKINHLFSKQVSTDIV